MNIAQALKKSLITAIAVVSMTCGAGNALADQVFDFSFAGAVNSGSGKFTLSDDLNGDGSFDLAGVVGTANGLTITGFSLFAGADNTFYNPPSDVTGYVNFGGISFSTLGGPDFNLFFLNGAYHIIDATLNANGRWDGLGVERIALSITAIPEAVVVGEVPEPGSVFLLSLGLFGLLAARRKRSP